MPQKLLILLAALLLFTSTVNATKSGADYLKELGSEFLEDFFVSFFNEKDNATAPDEYLFVPYIKTSGIHRDYEKYILVTFSQYVRDASRYILVSADRSDRNIKVGSDKYVNARARAKGAINVLYIWVHRVGDNIVFNFTIKSASDNSVVWKDEYRAIIPEDIAPILFRAATTMGTGRKGSNPKSFYDSDTPVCINPDAMEDIVATQEQIQRTKNPRRFTHLSFSFNGSLEFGDGKVMSGMAIGAWYDFRHFIVSADLEALGTLTSDTTVTNVGLGLTVPMSTDNNAPFGMLNVGISSTKYDQEDEEKRWEGLTIEAGAGYLFNRYHFLPIRFTLKYFRNMYQSEGHHFQGATLEATIGI